MLVSFAKIYWTMPGYGSPNGSFVSVDALVIEEHCRIGLYGHLHLLKFVVNEVR